MPGTLGVVNGACQALSQLAARLSQKKVKSKSKSTKEARPMTRAKTYNFGGRIFSTMKSAEANAAAIKASRPDQFVLGDRPVFLDPPDRTFLVSMLTESHPRAGEMGLHGLLPARIAVYYKPRFNDPQTDPWLKRWLKADRGGTSETCYWIKVGADRAIPVWFADCLAGVYAERQAALDAAYASALAERLAGVRVAS
jgi:hypothetical protein